MASSSIWSFGGGSAESRRRWCNFLGVISLRGKVSGSGRRDSMDHVGLERRASMSTIFRVSDFESAEELKY